MAEKRLAAAAADPGQARVFFDLDPPALVVGQVPVKNIQLVHRHRIQKPVEELDRRKMPAHIEHRPPPGKSRAIRDADEWDLPSDPIPRATAENRRGKKLQKRLGSAKNPRPAARAQHGSLPVHVQPVGFRIHAVLPPDHDPPGRSIGCFNRNRKSGRGTKSLGQQAGLGQKIRIQTRDGEGFVERQASRLNVGLGRLRDQRKECGHKSCATTRSGRLLHHDMPHHEFKMPLFQTVNSKEEN